MESIGQSHQVFRGAKVGVDLIDVLGPVLRGDQQGDGGERAIPSPLYLHRDSLNRQPCSPQGCLLQVISISNPVGQRIAQKMDVS